MALFLQENLLFLSPFLSNLTHSSGNSYENHQAVKCLVVNFLLTFPWNVLQDTWNIALYIKLICYLL